jgi:hypothetical protein
MTVVPISDLPPVKRQYEESNGPAMPIANSRPMKCSVLHVGQFREHRSSMSALAAALCNGNAACVRGPNCRRVGAIVAIVESDTRCSVRTSPRLREIYRTGAAAFTRGRAAHDHDLPLARNGLAWTVS